MTSRLQQATDYDAWTAYVDPCGVYTEDAFMALSVEEKLAIIEDVFGPEETEGMEVQNEVE